MNEEPDRTSAACKLIPSPDPADSSKTDPYVPESFPVSLTEDTMLARANWPANPAEAAELVPVGAGVDVGKGMLRAEVGRDMSPGARLSRQRAFTWGIVALSPSASRYIVTGRPA